MPVFEMLTHPLGQRLALALVHFLWQGFAVAGLVVLVLAAGRMRRASARYAVCLAAFVVMSACPLITFAEIGETEDPLSAALAGPGTDGAVAEARPSGQVAEPRATGMARLDVSPVLARPAKWREVLVEAVAVAQPWIVLGWLVGVLILSGRLLLGGASLRRLPRDLHDLSPELQARVARLCDRLRIRALPRIAARADLAEALALGFVRPFVLLPAAWLTELSPDLLEAVIAHELAHLRRGDLWVNLFQRIVEAVLFYHPAVWWLSHRLRAEREMCCDELAVSATRERVVYVTALERVARLRLAADQPLLAASMGSKRRVLLERVRYLLGMIPAAHPTSRWLAGLMALALPVLFWLSVHNALTGEVPPEERKILEKMAEGYDKNRNVFRFLTCRFEVITGEAATIEDAVKGKITPRTTERGLWLVKGDKVRYELLCDQAPKTREELQKMLRPVEGKVKLGNAMEIGLATGVPCANKFVLIGGSLAFRPTLLFQCAGIGPQPSRDLGDNDFAPFTMIRNPSTLIQACLAKKMVARYDGEEQIDGVKTLSFGVGPEREKIGEHFNLDPRRGYLPIRSWRMGKIRPDQKEEKRVGETYLTDVREYSGGRWFPWRSVNITILGDQGPYRFVREIKVLELDLDKPPADDRFAYDIPKGTLLGDSEAKTVSWFKLERDERITADSLPQWNEKVVAQDRK